VKRDRQEPGSRPPSLRQLGVVLGAAADIVRELSADRHLPRLLRVFLQLPPPDRAPVLGILEREVAARQASVAAGDGIVGPPNGLGTIYMRIFENDFETPRVTRDDMVRSTFEATALMTNFPAPLAEETETALFVALDALTDAEAAALAAVHDDVVAILGSVP
jgi:hypothetical protein